jgi:excisionase family DNA binding protein
MDKLMTTDEVADLLSVKESTIRKWVHLKQIPVVRLGRAVRFSHETIEDWIKEKTEKEQTWDRQCHGAYS